MENRMTLNFSIEDVSIYEATKGNRFSSAVINCFASGENAHTLPIDENVLIRCAESIYNIPLNYTMNIFKSDFIGHKEANYILGFIPEKEDNNIQLVRCDDGRLFLKIKALIWNRYAKDALKILQNKRGETSVSAELSLTKVVESREGIEVLEFVFEAITLLGTQPAIKGAKLNMLFDEDKKEFLKGIKFEDNFISINNSNENALDSRWYNGRKRLFNEISMSANKTDLLSEAFLKINGTENYADVLYPHHVISNGEMVLHKKGVKFAFQEVVNNSDLGEETILHLFRHFLEMGLNETNYCSFGITQEQFDLYFAKLLKGGKESMAVDKNLKPELDNGEGTTVLEDENKDKVFEEPEEGKDVIIEEPEEGKDVVIDEPDVVVIEEPEEGKDVVIDEPDEGTDDNDTIIEDESTVDKKDKNEGEDPQFTQEEFENICAKFAKAQQLNDELQAKIDSMSDYDELVKFKADVEEAEARATEMQAMDKIFGEVLKRGVTMSEEEKDNLKTKVKEFSSVESWGNYVKAYMFDRMDTNNTLTRIDIPNLHEPIETKTNSIWG